MEMKKLQPNTYFRFIGDPIFKVLALPDGDKMRIKAIKTGNEWTVSYPVNEDEYTIISEEEAMLARLAGRR